MAANTLLQAHLSFATSSPFVRGTVCAAMMAAVVTSLGCGPSKGPRCATIERDSRLEVALKWEVAHPSIDADPPAPQISLTIRTAGRTERVMLGTFAGLCRLVDMGTQPPEPLVGAVISEVVCSNGNRDMVAQVVNSPKLDIVIRRFVRLTKGTNDRETIGENDVATVLMPRCPAFVVEMGQAPVL